MTMRPLSKFVTSSSLALLLVTISYPSIAATTSRQNSASTANQQTLTQQALNIQQALANKNYASIVKDIHPTRGVRFSMSALVHTESDKVFSRAQFAQYLKQSKIRFTWGDLEGNTDLLVVPLPTYLNTWVNGSKFNNARITINEFKASNNRFNNVADIYQQSNIVDFYYNGTDKYDNRDWRSMSLVFDTYKGKRYLVAIVNNQASINV